MFRFKVGQTIECTTDTVIRGRIMRLTDYAGEWYTIDKVVQDYPARYPDAQHIQQHNHIVIRESAAVLVSAEDDAGRFEHGEHGR